VATIGLLHAGSNVGSNVGLAAGELTAGELAAAGTGLEARESVTSGFRSLDGLLPAGGVRRGSLVEWLYADEASGAATVAFAVACRLAGCGSDRGDGLRHVPPPAAGTIIVVDRQGRFHPPAVMPWLGGRQLVVTRPSGEDDETWAIDQSLRCPGVAAVLAWPKRIHATAMRRWQLAARASRAVGLLVRPEAARREPSWAEARVAVSAVPGESPAVRRLRLTLAGGPWSGGEVGDDRFVEVVLDLMRGCEEADGRRRAVWERAGQLAADERPAGRGAAVRPPRIFRPGDRPCRAS
jgi:protein ImuA